MREACGFGNISTEVVSCSEDDGCTRTLIARCVFLLDPGLSFPLDETTAREKKQRLYLWPEAVCVHICAD